MSSSEAGASSVRGRPMGLRGDGALIGTIVARLLASAAADSGLLGEGQRNRVGVLVDPQPGDEPVRDGDVHGHRGGKSAPVARMVWLKTPNTTASAPSTSTWLTVLSVWVVSHTDHSVVKYALTSSRRDRAPVHGTRSSPGTSQSTVSANNSATHWARSGPAGSPAPAGSRGSSRLWSS